MAQKDNEQINLLWFDFYVKELDNSRVTDYKTFDTAIAALESKLNS